MQVSCHGSIGHAWTRWSTVGHSSRVMFRVHDPAYAFRHITSPLYATLGREVCPHDPRDWDADSLKLYNTGTPMSNGFTFVGDHLAGLFRNVEFPLRDILFGYVSANAIDAFIEGFGTPNGDFPYPIFATGLFDHISNEDGFEFTDAYRLLALKRFMIDAAFAYPWDRKILRSEMLTNEVRVVTEVSQGNPVEVVRGPPPLWNHRIPIRLAARVILTHINTTFGNQLPLPAAFPTDLDLTLQPEHLPPTPPPVVHGSNAPSPDATQEPDYGGGSSSGVSMTPRSLADQFEDMED